VSPLEYLRHIIDEADYLISASQTIGKIEFLRDETLKRAFVRSWEIIGEASRKVPADIEERYPEIEWRLMSGIRDRLIHGYFGVDHDLVWDAVTNKIPEVRKRTGVILSNEGS
jgi:uncharacterized protein with HEPN domain